MRRRTLFKLFALAPAAAFMKPRRLLGPDDIVSDGALTSLTIQAYQIDDIIYTDNLGTPPEHLAGLADGTAAIEYQP